MTLQSGLKRESPKHRPFRWFLAISLGATLGIAAGFNLKATVSIVDGESMAPTFRSGAYVLAKPIASALTRGDIVLVDDDKEEYALKRIVGMPGETIHLWRGFVFINRTLLFEPYLPRYTLTAPDQRRQQNKFELGADEYFVMGDNRLYSSDSRYYGPVRRNHIKSRISAPHNDPRAEFRPYTLPDLGKTLIRPKSPERPPSTEPQLAGGNNLHGF